ncbi:MAG: phosphatidate cytidylyltransferase [Endozoicomonadaceae bacterium]|nr:phosphatidate cytidylyltransferase [Endozoicomonadaceae bacterium]
MSKLKQRTIAAAIMIPLALIVIFLLSVNVFCLITGVILLVAAWEWANIADLSWQPLRIFYALITGALLFFSSKAEGYGFFLGTGFAWWILAVMFILSYPESKKAWQPKIVKLIIGWLVLIPAWQALVFIRTRENGAVALLCLFSIIWIADIAAYFFGNWFGRHKLLVQVSPGKTWQGAIAAAVIVAIGSAVVAKIAGGFSWFYLVGISVASVVIVAFSIAGDLLESMFKRERGIKDSSNIIPGHGGLLDRIDSLTAAAPVFAIFLSVLTGF